MEISPTLVQELSKHGISYDIISHPYSEYSLNTARSVRIPESELVKSVILEDDQGYIMALVPADQHVKIRQVNQLLQRNVGLTTENTLQNIFCDCDPGAIPPVGEAYDLETIVDYHLDDCDDLYIEAGNHQDLLHLSGSSFRKLMQHCRHANICVH